MAISKLAILSICIALIFTHISADVSVDRVGDDVVEVVRSDASDSELTALKVEVKELKSKIQKLEKNEESKRKDDIIALKDKIIRAKLDAISSLESQIASLQKKGKLDVEEKVGKAYAHAQELEKQVDDFKRELETLNREKESWETRANEAEKKIREVNLKLEDLKKINEEQKIRIRKTERALDVSKEEMRKAKFEAASKITELTEVNGAWLPPWLASHFVQYRSLIVAHWNERAKPAIDVVIQKALEKKAQAAKWAEPHVKTVKTKYIPTLKEKWLEVKSNVEPHVQILTTKTAEFYGTSKSVVTPYVAKFQEALDPYYLEVKKVSKPYIDQVATVTKPHLEKVKVVLKPYTKQLVQAYGKFLESAAMYHHQVQATVKETLKTHELTRPFATREFEWFAASAVLALPIIILFNIFPAIFWKKPRKPLRNANTNGARRKGKRAHPDR